MSNLAAIDGMVFDFFMRGAETVVHDRKANVQPMSTGSSSGDCTEYIRHTVHSWKRQLSRPMNIDLYVFNNSANSHILMERWNFTYTYSPESSEISSNTIINQRIQVLLRSLYSFIRLLPGFNLLQCSQIKPLITIQIYDPKISPEAFRYESSNYSFPSISTSKGSLSMSVSFTNPGIIKEILRAISGGPLIGLPSPSTIRVDKNDTNKQHSQSIPIPGRTPPVDPYRTRVYSDSRDNQPRRSFKEEGGLTAALRAEYAQARSLESRGGGEVTGLFPSSVGSSGPSRSGGGGGGGLMYPGNFAGSGEVPFGTSPSSHSGKIMVYGQQQTNIALNAFSYQASTPPPFAYLPSFDISSNSNIDIPRASPPYYQISSSLNSTSPHLGPSQLTALMDRRHSWRKSINGANSTALSNSLRSEAFFAAVEQELSKMKVALPPSPFAVLEKVDNKNDVAKSAGIAKSFGSDTSGGTRIGIGIESPHIPTNPQPSNITAMTIGDIENIEVLPATNTLPSRNSNNRLDIVAKYEKERERRNSDVLLYDSYPDSRTVSISETTRDKDDDTMDAAIIDEDTPFATYRPSFSSSSVPMASLNGPIAAITSSSAASLAPILAILNRGNNRMYYNSHGIGMGGTSDGVGGNGVPLPMLTHDLQRTLQEHKQFIQQYAASRNIPLATSFPHSKAAPSK